MLKYRRKEHSKYWPAKWKSIDYAYCKHHLNFDKFVYINENKIYSASSYEVRELFNTEKAQFKLWNILQNDN